jgi:hypothetical protein
MKKRPYIYLILALVIALGACSDPVFYMISVEPPITEPLIGGSPTNFVVYDNKVYVASGRNIYSYDGTSFKRLSSQPGGRIMQLAATGSFLYALCLQDSGGNTNLKRYSSSEGWKDVTGDTGGYGRFQSVYAANDKVFIGAERNGSFIILYMADNDAGYKPLRTVDTNDTLEHMLCGIAYDSLNSNYYLCTRSNTIYAADENLKDIQPKKIDGVNFTGIINLEINDFIVAISRSGDLYNVKAISDEKDTSDLKISIGSSRYSTGALAVWRDETGTPKLLLAGRQDSLVYTVDSGYTYGYMELELDSGGVKADANFKAPGTSPSSVADNERYVSTIGKYPVNHIFQASDGILFASTQKNGVWSYRVRDNTPQWNAEE